MRSLGIRVDSATQVQSERPVDTGVASSKRRVTMVMVGYLVGPFLSMIDSSIVNVALVDISKSLSANVGDVQWVVSSYVLAMAAALPLTAWLSRRFGLTRVFVLSVAGFTVTSVACGLSPNLAALVAARTLQGLFAAFLIPLAMTKLLETSDPGHYGRGSLPALFGLILFMAPAIAPSLGGFLLQVAGWPLIFFVNVPFGIFGVWILSRGRKAEKGTRSTPFDFVGLIVLSGGLAGVTFGSSRATSEGWFGAGALPYWLAGLAAVALYVRLAFRKKAPAVSLKSLQRREVLAADLVSMLTSVAAFGMIVLSLVFLQQVKGIAALSAGIAMIPQALLTGLGTGVSPKVVERIGLRWTATGGLCLLVAGTLLLEFVGPQTSLLLISLMLTGRAFAIGLVIQPLAMMINSELPRDERTEANTVFMICQRLGGALGVSVIVTFFQKRSTALIRSLGRDASYAAFHQSIEFLTLVAVVSMVLTLALFRNKGARDRQAACNAARAPS